MLPAVGSRVTDCLAGYVAIYAHMVDFGLRFFLDRFIVKIFWAWDICLSQLTLLGWRNQIAYAWTIGYKRFPGTLNMFRELHWNKEDDYVKGKGGRPEEKDIACR